VNEKQLNIKIFINNIYKLTKIYKLKAPLKEVWKALTNSKTLTKWQGQKCSITKNKVILFGGDTIGKIIEIKPMEKISHTWRMDYQNKKWKDSIVTYLLTEKNDKIIIKLEHTNFPNKKRKGLP